MNIILLFDYEADWRKFFMVASHMAVIKYTLIYDLCLYVYIRKYIDIQIALHVT